MMARLLGIDVGTSGCKALLVNENGEILAQASAEYPLSTPQAGWSEQNPEDWWRGVSKCLAEIGEPNPDAMGITGQMHGAVFLDSADEVIRPAILWNDQRTVAECAEIDMKVGAARVREITCNPPLTGFQLPKILWMRNNEPDSFGRVRSVLLPKDYIRLRLTGSKATEASDASGTGAFDVGRREWSDEILSALALKPELFPSRMESDLVAGTTKSGSYLAGGIPVVGGGGDQAAAAVGTGAVLPGVVSVSLGTSGVVFTALDRPVGDPTGASHVFCHANRGWHAMGVMLSCGGALRWFRDTLGAGRGYDDLALLAASSEIGSRGVTFVPYLAGERCPHNEPLARAAFGGVGLSNGLGDVTRSVFEAVSFGLLECLLALQNLGAEYKEIRVTGGGARSAFWLQMLVDIFGQPCRTLTVDEGPAFGAALLAGAGIGVWPDVQTACQQAVREKRTFQPSDASPQYQAAFTRYQDLSAVTRKWARQ